MMQRDQLRLRLEVLAVRHGLWPLPAAALLLAALLAWGWWLPAQEAALGEARAALAAQGEPVKSAPASAVRGPDLPPAVQAPRAVQRLFALAAEHGLKIAQADYRRQESGRVGRWQVQVPASGSYPQVRRFVRAAQAVPGLSLDEIGLHRAGAQGIEARMLFSVWFALDQPATGEAR